jgi:hypothetical protein
MTRSTMPLQTMLTPTESRMNRCILQQNAPVWPSLASFDAQAAALDNVGWLSQ